MVVLRYICGLLSIYLHRELAGNYAKDVNCSRFCKNGTVFVGERQSCQGESLSHFCSLRKSALVLLGTSVLIYGRVSSLRYSSCIMNYYSNCTQCRSAAKLQYLIVIYFQYLLVRLDLKSRQVSREF